MPSSAEIVIKDNFIIQKLEKTITELNELLSECSDNKLEVDLTIINLTRFGDLATKKIITCTVTKLMKRF